MNRRFARRLAITLPSLLAAVLPATAHAQAVDRDVYRSYNRPHADAPTQSGLTRDQMQLRSGSAGGGARTIDQLSAGIAATCSVQPWELAIRAASRTQPDAIKVQRSSTMSVRENACVDTVIGKSRFYVAR